MARIKDTKVETRIRKIEESLFRLWSLAEVNNTSHLAMLSMISSLKDSIDAMTSETEFLRSNLKPLIDNLADEVITAKTGKE